MFNYFFVKVYFFGDLIFFEGIRFWDNVVGIVGIFIEEEEFVFVYVVGEIRVGYE